MKKKISPSIILKDRVRKMAIESCRMRVRLALLDIHTQGVSNHSDWYVHCYIRELDKISKTLGKSFK